MTKKVQKNVDTGYSTVVTVCSTKKCCAWFGGSSNLASW